MTRRIVFEEDPCGDFIHHVDGGVSRSACWHPDKPRFRFVRREESPAPAGESEVEALAARLFVASRGHCDGHESPRECFDDAEKFLAERDRRRQQQPPAAEPGRDAAAAPDYTCCACGSMSGFSTVINRFLPGEADDYDMKCDACGSTHVEESPREALGVVVGDRDAAREALDRVTHQLDLCTLERDAWMESARQTREALDTVARNLFTGLRWAQDGNPIAEHAVVASEEACARLLDDAAMLTALRSCEKALRSCVEVLAAMPYETRRGNGGAGQQAFDSGRAALARAQEVLGG